MALRYAGFKTLLWALAISHAAIIATSLAYDPALHFRYLGLLGDPNQLGMLSLMAGILVIFAIPPALQRLPRQAGSVLLLTTVLMATISLIILSSHRTSILTIAACLIISVGRFRRMRVKGLTILIPCILAIGGFVASSDEGRQVLEQLIEKNSSAIDRGELLSGREGIWRLALENINMFGHGKQFFTDNTNGLGAHNSLLHILGTRGLLAAVMLVVLCGQSFYYVFLLCKDDTVDYDSSQGPLLVTVAFWMLSMTEGVFGSIGTGINIGFLVTLGYAASVATTRHERLRHIAPAARPNR